MEPTPSQIDPTMRLLVVGAGGQVGRRVVRRALTRGHAVFGTSRSRPVNLPTDAQMVLDKTDPKAIRVAFERFRPEGVIDTGALHNVDYCESHPAEAQAVNAEGPRHLARACREASARFLFVSTDFVFGGDGNPPYSETDPAHPISEYGRSKLNGELATLEECPDGLVARPSVIFSWNPPGGAGTTSGKGVDFGSWLAGQLEAKTPVRLVTDQIASPTHASDLAEALVRLLESAARGVFHTAGSTACSRFDFAREVARLLGAPEALLIPIRTSDLAQKARRPADSSLRSDRLARELSYRMASMVDAVNRFGQERALWKEAIARRSAEVAHPGSFGT